MQFIHSRSLCIRVAFDKSQVTGKNCKVKVSGNLLKSNIMTSNTYFKISDSDIQGFCWHETKLLALQHQWWCSINFVKSKRKPKSFWRDKKCFYQGKIASSSNRAKYEAFNKKNQRNKKMHKRGRQTCWEERNLVLKKNL